MNKAQTDLGSRLKRGFKVSFDIDDHVSLTRLQMITGLKPTVEVCAKNIAFEIIMMNRYVIFSDIKIIMFFTLIHIAIMPLYNKIYQG